MVSKTEMFLSDQFLSTCWKCWCFCAPMSWCSPFSLTLALQSWCGLRCFSFLSTYPFQNFCPPLIPLLVIWSSPGSSHTCALKGTAQGWQTHANEMAFICVTAFPGQRDFLGTTNSVAKGLLVPPVREICCPSRWAPSEAHPLGDFRHSQEVLKQTVLRPLRVGSAKEEETACSGGKGHSVCVQMVLGQRHFYIVHLSPWVPGK